MPLTEQSLWLTIPMVSDLQSSLEIPSHMLQPHSHLSSGDPYWWSEARILWARAETSSRTQRSPVNCFFLSSWDCILATVLTQVTRYIWWLTQCVSLCNRPLLYVSLMYVVDSAGESKSLTIKEHILYHLCLRFTTRENHHQKSCSTPDMKSTTD